MADNYVHNDDMPDMSDYQTTSAASAESSRLENLINGKASQTALNNLSSVVNNKASKSFSDRWQARFDKDIIYVKDMIDVTYNGAQFYYVELNDINNLTLNEDFSALDYKIAHFYISALAAMDVTLKNKIIRLLKNHFYHLVIMQDDNGNTREFIFEGL